jgi:hypothetical protein
MDGGMEELVKEAYNNFHLFAEFSKHAATIGQLGEKYSRVVLQQK